MTYHTLIPPVSYSIFGRVKSSCLGVGVISAPSLETLMTRTRSLELEAAVDSSSGRSVLVSKKWAR